jgi:methylmalonyl-CoA/ethylmalonyl-CoA epimerase
MDTIAKLAVHHFGCLTKNMDASIETYKSMGFTNASEIYVIKAQNVRVCFIAIGNNVFLELVEFTDDSAALKALFKSKNPYYHVGYLAEDIRSTIAELVAKGFYLVNEFSSEAFNGRTCAFLYSPEMHLIELIEA